MITASSAPLKTLIFAILCVCLSLSMRPNFVRTPLASRRIAYEGDPVRTLLIDNYDSYTYNLWQLLAEVNGVEPQVVLNDAFGGSWTRCAKNSPPFDNIVISPGPGRPDYKEDFGMCADAILHADVPLLGVCLGHQGISSAFGGKVVRGRKPMHGRLSALVHDGSGLFRNLPIETKVVRYHSLTVERSSLPSVLRPIAWTVDGEIMGLEHTSKAMFGVQFHPESVCTVAGRQILSNFRDITLQKMGAARVVQDPTGCAVASTSMKYNKLPIDSRGLAFEADRPTHRANTISFGSAEHKLSAPNSNSGAVKDIAGAHDNFVRENESVRVVDLVRELSRKKFVHVISVFPPPNSPKTAAVTTEQVFEQLYGGQAASFWLDSACPGPVQLDCPTSDGLDCSAGAGALHTDKASSGGPGASTEADETTKRCIHGEPGETTERANAGQKERFSYMGAVDTEAACAVEYSGDRQLFLRSPLSPHQPCRRVNQSILEYLRDQLQLEEETETLVLHTNIDQLDSSTPISGSTAVTSLNMSDWKVLSSLSSFKFTASGAFFGYLGYELGVETTQILAAAASKPTSAPYKASPTTSVSPTLGKVRNGETTAAGIEGFEGAASSSSSSSSSSSLSSSSSSSSSRRGPFYDLSALRGAGWDRDLVPPQLQPHRATAGTAGTEAEAKEVVGGHAVLTPGDRVRNKQWGRKALSEQPMAVLLRPSRYVVYDHSRDVYHVVSVALEEGAEIGRDEGADTKQIAEACEAAEPSRAARGAVEVGQDLAQRLIAVLGGKLLQPQCSFPVDKDTADASGGASNLSLETPTQSQSPLNDLTPLQQEEASPRLCAPTPAPAPAPAPTALLMACKSPAPAPAPAPTALLMACKSRAAYRRDIASCLEYIGEGESYEVCLTLQFRGRRSDPSQAPLRTYQALRRRNPAPYACYLRYDPVALMLPQQQPQQQPQQPASSGAADGSSNGQANTTAAGLEWYTHGGITVCSTSPECFLHISQSGEVTSRPIKGTARRAPLDPAQDLRVRAELAADEKSQAENLMIADLVRNDLGRVCEVGSVRVPEGGLMHVESYATVHQMVTTVTGQLRGRGRGHQHNQEQNQEHNQTNNHTRPLSVQAEIGIGPRCDTVDALVATFPGGSMTGAPKLRTMSIIQHLESHPRGVYSGAMGFIGLDGAADLNIVIRTAVLAGDHITVGAGGAIVALSDPEQEVDEVLLKARAVSSSLGYQVQFPDS